MMTNNRVERLPVASKDSGRLVGMVTMSDIIGAYRKTVKALPAS